jgi:hypothetical protein
MSRNKPPRRPYRPRPVTADTLTLALHHAAKPSAADRAEVLGVLHQAARALREGVATELQWSIVSGAVAVALAIERQGIVRGALGHLQTADQALQRIRARALRTGGGHWARVDLDYDELDALADFVGLHTWQVNSLGRAEFLAAIDAAQKDIRVSGCGVVVVRELERMAA